MSTRLPRFAALAASALVVACGGATSPSSAPPASSPPSSAPASIGPSAQPSPSATTASLVLKVTSEGGFINPSANLAALPIVEVYGDGRILTPGPVDAIAPGPLVTPVEVRMVGPAGAAAIVAAIGKAGLDRPSTAGPGVPGDSGSDIFSVTLDGQTTDTRLSGNGPGPGGPGGPGAGGSGDPARAAAFDVLNRLLDPNETWGASSAPRATYNPTAWRIFVAPGAPSTDPSMTQAPVAWPLSTALDAFGTPAVPDRGIAGLRQGVVLGPDAVTLGPLLVAATTATGFTSGGKTYTLFARALLPDELGG